MYSVKNEIVEDEFITIKVTTTIDNNKRRI